MSNDDIIVPWYKTPISISYFELNMFPCFIKPQFTFRRFLSFLTSSTCNPFKPPLSTRSTSISVREPANIMEPEEILGPITAEGASSLTSHGQASRATRIILLFDSSSHPFVSPANHQRRSLSPVSSSTPSCSRTRPRHTHQINR